jgi:DMSO/TMAO reductase YedYZ molybdopterin-dependent catalytic subunit
MSDPRHLVVERQPYNAEVPLAELEREPGEGALFVRTHFGVPSLRAEDHRLQVVGAVERPLMLGLAELRRWPARRVEVTLECAGNGRSLVEPRPPGTPWGLGAAGTAVFEGVALADVLREAGVAAGAVEVLAVGRDAGTVASGSTVRFERSLPLAVALGPDVLLARAMNAAPLAPEHGHPLRLVVPGWYGVASVKWLDRIELLRQPFTGWFQRDTYVYQGQSGVADGSPVGAMRLRSLLTFPAEGATLPVAPVVLRGVAWSGTGSVVSVAWSADDGASWDEGTLEPARGSWLPRRWRATWTPPAPGAHTLLCRARDEGGAEQPLRPAWNRLGYGNNAAHRVRVSVR